MKEVPKSKGFRKISEESVRSRTGRGWKEWFEILDDWGMKEKGHKLTAKHLEQKYGVGPWWSQAITIRYEWEKGLRK